MKERTILLNNDKFVPFLFFRFSIFNSIFVFSIFHFRSWFDFRFPIFGLLLGASLAQLLVNRTLDRKVAGSNLTRGAVLCPRAKHFMFIA